MSSLWTLSYLSSLLRKNLVVNLIVGILANLIIRRVKLNFGRIGYFETTLKRLGRPDYTQIYEAKPMDQYDANDLGYTPDYEETTPVYQRNTTFVMSIHAEATHPLAVLYDATWEGTYTENYVKRL